MKISLIQPTRNNLKYLKWSYDSIRKNQGNHTVEICIADDFSNDGTWDWCLDKMNSDTNFKAIRNDGPQRLGHTILYDRLINEVSSHDICMIFHADMYLCPGALDAIEKNIKEKTIVSLTRIEPPLHPPGPEKVFIDWGATEPEQFDEDKFLKWFSSMERKEDTVGIFAPWAFYKKDFQEIGGHDPLYAPQSKEDSDIFNRFQLNGVQFIQTWEGYVYHMTCRGSRFNPTLTTPGKNSSEWEAQNIRSTRNFIRKWGQFVKHDEHLKPIIPPKYNIVFSVKNCNNIGTLQLLEPWCDYIYIEDLHIKNEYVKLEQPNTKFNLDERIRHISNSIFNPGVLVEFDAALLNQERYNFLTNLPTILSDSGEIGIMEYDIFTLTINSLETYEKNLIHL